MASERFCICLKNVTRRLRHVTVEAKQSNFRGVIVFTDLDFQLARFSNSSNGIEFKPDVIEFRAVNLSHIQLRIGNLIVAVQASQIHKVRLWSKRNWFGIKANTDQTHKKYPAMTWQWQNRFARYFFDKSIRVINYWRVIINFENVSIVLRWEKVAINPSVWVDLTTKRSTKLKEKNFLVELTNALWLSSHFFDEWMRNTS